MPRMTEKQLKEYCERNGLKYRPGGKLLQPRDPKRKYRNIPEEIDGYRFDSKLEALRYEQLKFHYLVGDIAGFGVHPSFAIAPGVRVEMDFIVWDKQGRIWVEDTKGYLTDKSEVKAKLFVSKYPCFELRILTKEDI